MNQKMIANLETIVNEAPDNDTCIVLFHGYGADFKDLAPLSDIIDIPKDVTWVFPNAPLEIMIAPRMTGRAWFEINVAALEQAMAQGKHRDLTQTRPEGIDYAVDLAHEMVEELQETYSNVILGGFSQGAMLATELSFRLDKKPTALIILSGTLLDQKNWETLATSCKGLPFFQSHGINDPLLSFKDAERLYQVLKKSGLEGKFYSFSGGHEIPLDILKKLGNFLGTLKS